MAQHLSVGSYGEQLASDWLKQKGYKILAQNYKKVFGEIDIVASKDKIIHFCEVKTNKADNLAFQPEMRVDRKRFQRLARTADIFLRERRLQTDWQIDIISVILNIPLRKATIRHFQNISNL